MAEGPAEGEWEEDAGMGAAAAERRREKEREREKARQAEEAEAQVTGPIQKVIPNILAKYIYTLHKYIYAVFSEVNS